MAPHMMGNSEAHTQIRWGVVTRVFAEVDAELVRAVGKHGLGRTPMNPNMDTRDAFVIIAEEFGEVARCLTYDGDRTKLDKELIQLCSMAAAMIVGMRLANGEQ